MTNDLFNDTNFPDLFLPEPGLVYITPAEEELIRVLPSELKAINVRIEHLERALSIQTLKLDVERAKRQQLKLMMKPQPHEIPTLQLEALKTATEANTARQESINFQLGGDLDRMNTQVFRCLSRIQQLMSFVLPCIQVTSSDHPDVTSLLEEIGRTLQQLCSYRQSTTYLQ